MSEKRWVYSMKIHSTGGPEHVLFVGTYGEAEAFMERESPGDWSFTGLPDFAKALTDATPNGPLRRKPASPNVNTENAWSNERRWNTRQGEGR